MPFRVSFNTRLVGSGKHRITAIAYDLTGNRSEVSRSVVVTGRVLGQGALSTPTCANDFPGGTFHVCYFDGVGFTGPYLGTLVDHPFPTPARNAGWGLTHEWGIGTVAFGRGDTISGVWRGRLAFRPGNYRLHFFTDDGLRVFVNGKRIIDEWRDQVAEFTRVVALSGETRIRIEWYQNAGAKQLRFFWLPTTAPPD
jgi:hypothetical protein